MFLCVQTGTTTLSLRDNKPVVVIHGKTNLSIFALLRSTVPYFTAPITSGYAEGLKIRFEPTATTQRSRTMMYRYNVIDLSLAIAFNLKKYLFDIKTLFKINITDNR